MKLSVIIPCFNEEDAIEATFARLADVAARLTPDYELVFVDDGSSDRTALKLKAICEANANVHVLRLSRNFGHQVAVTAGLDYVSGDAVVIIDADLQDPPEVIEDFIAKWREGYHVVYGHRLERARESWFKKATAHLFYRLINRLSDVPIPLDVGDFRLMDRRVVEALKRMPERYRLLRAMVSWVGFRQTSVSYSRAERFAGVTKYPLRRMLALALDGIISFSTVPLRIMTVIGFFVFVLALLGIAYSILLRVLTDIWVPGWTLQFIAQLLLGGLNMLGLGLLGEYIGRIYGEAKQRPLFIVMESFGSDDMVDGKAEGPAHQRVRGERSQQERPT